MKRILWLPLLCLLLSACGAAEERDRAAVIQERFAAHPDYRAEVRVELPRADETLRFALSVACTDGETHLTVREPETLAGVGAAISGEELTLRFDGAVLDAGGLSPRVSALNCVPILAEAAASGWIVSSGADTLDGAEALRVDFEAERADGTLRCAIWFSPEDTPLYAEIGEDGKIIAFAEFTSFAFRDILN